MTKSTFTFSLSLAFLLALSVNASFNACNSHSNPSIVSQGLESVGFLPSKGLQRGQQNHARIQGLFQNCHHECPPRYNNPVQQQIYAGIM